MESDNANSNSENVVAIELYGKSLPKLQFVYSKRKVSTKLFMHQNEAK